MNKVELDLMYKEGLISDEAYQEILKDINIVNELETETTELKTELTELKNVKGNSIITSILKQYKDVELNVEIQL